MINQHTFTKLIGFSLYFVLSSACLCFGDNPKATTTSTPKKPVKIVAVIGSEVISDYDLEERTKFTLHSSAIPDTAETRAQFQPKILDMMIDEQLKRQEATKLGIKNSPADINDAINNIEEKNGMKKGTLKTQLTEAGLSFDTFRLQVDADLLWIKYVRAAIWNTITVTDKEVQTVQAAVLPTSDQTRYNLSEIFLPIPEPEKADEVYESANELLTQLRNGANFGAIALQFSRGPQAYKGGEIGWVIEDVLNKEAVEALKTLPVGEISLPIRTPDGYHIFLLNDRQVSTKVRQFELAKVTVPASYKAEHPDFTQTLTEQKTCQDFLKYGKQASEEGTGMLGLITFSALTASIQNLLKDVPEGRISAPLSTEKKDVFFMVCKDKTGAKGGDLPSLETIKERITAEKAEALAQRKLREIRKNTIIEKRI